MAAGASQCIFFLYDHAMTGADQSKIDHAGVVVCAPAWACTRLRGSGGGHPGMYDHLTSGRFVEGFQVPDHHGLRETLLFLNLSGGADGHPHIWVVSCGAAVCVHRT